MTKKNKITRWDLEDEVLYLKNTEKKSDHAIAEHISNKYADIPELHEISAMSVNRFLNSHNESMVEKELDKVKDPTKFIQQQFNIKMRESIQDTESARQTIQKYMDELRSGDLKAGEVSKLISSWQKINDQYRKNLVSLREFTDNRIIRPTQNIIYKKEINIKNLLLDISRDLCPACRKRIQEKLEDLKEEKNG